MSLFVFFDQILLFLNLNTIIENIDTKLLTLLKFLQI